MKGVLSSRALILFPFHHECDEMEGIDAMENGTVVRRPQAHVERRGLDVALDARGARRSERCDVGASVVIAKTIRREALALVSEE